MVWDGITYRAWSELLEYHYAHIKFMSMKIKDYCCFRYDIGNDNSGTRETT